jgi:acid phosphatase type 7
LLASIHPFRTNAYPVMSRPLAAFLAALVIRSREKFMAAATAAPCATLDVNATEPLETNGAWVRVTWSVANCQQSDSNTNFIALLPVDSPDISATSPLKLAPTYGAQNGSFSFYLYNLRTPSTFKLYRGPLTGRNEQPPELLATAATLVTWQWPNEPTGVHLALTGNASEMRITWTTMNETAPVVRYAALQPDSVMRAVSATSAVLQRGDMYGDAKVTWTPSRPMELSSNATGIGFVNLGTQHTAVMTGLLAGVKYVYTVGSNDTGDGSSSRTFSGQFTQPPSASDEMFAFLVTADMGAADVDGSNWDDSGLVASRTELSMRGWDNRPSTNTTAQMLRCTFAVAGCGASPPAQMVFVNGDISYARGFGAIWQAFVNQMQPLACRVPIMTAPGNHEQNWPGVGSAWNVSSLDSGGEGGVAYAHLFPMPPTASKGGDEYMSWYSFDIGAIHFVVLSTEEDLSEGSAQVTWLEADLHQASVRDTPPSWTFVMAHRFFYIDSSNPDNDAASAAALRSAVEPLFVRYSVDATFTGHHHSYQRTQPGVVNGQLTGAARPVHIVAGHGGAGLSGLSDRPELRRLFATPNGLVQEHGFLHVAVNATTMVVTALRSSDGAVVDKFTMDKA